MRTWATVLLLLMTMLVGCAGSQVRSEGPLGSASGPEPVDQIRPMAAPRGVTAGAGVHHAVGHSVEGRPIEAIRIGWGRTRIVVIGGIHGNEQEGLPALDAVIAALGARASEVRGLVIADMNPDGTASGSRGNARGVDLNRNWPASNFQRGRDRGESALSEPETRCVFEALGAHKPDLVVVFHSTSSGPFVNHDGPAGALAAAFVRGAQVADRRWRVVHEMGYPTPGSLGSLVGVDRGVPILTIEFDRGQSAASVIAGVEGGFAELLRELLTGSPRSERPPR